MRIMVIILYAEWGYPMVHIKTPEEIERMRKAGRILARCHDAIEGLIRPGMTTMELNDFTEKFLKQHGARQVLKGYKGFPYAICASVNDVIAHGFPDRKPLKSGDIVKIDIVCRYRGWLADMTRTYPVGSLSARASRLVRIARECMDIGIRELRPGRRIGDVMHEVQRHAENAGYSVVRELVGHGIGRTLHEEPLFPHLGKRGEGFLLQEGMVITIEPIINEGGAETFLEIDGWTMRTMDGSLSAQFEHTVAITKTGPLILTV